MLSASSPSSLLGMAEKNAEPSIEDHFQRLEELNAECEALREELASREESLREQAEELGRVILERDNLQTQLEASKAELSRKTRYVEDAQNKVQNALDKTRHWQRELEYAVKQNGALRAEYERVLRDNPLRAKAIPEKRNALREPRVRLMQG